MSDYRDFTTVKPLCNTIDSARACCYKHVVASMFCTETSETVPKMCDVVSSDFVMRFDCIICDNG